ncbi:hypothetical protein ElyMa_005062000 [Elysia marginata]|uniref:Uncharacterized protein n=1 Tax=Elysia marginata TaxID=1093978 RepID=A0AAV4JE71_9GAST|nr:hypothetical protein ElyMa_005062000 [Elysia marginata]
MIFSRGPEPRERFHANIKDCLREPFETHCSPHVTNLLLDVLGKFMPPLCTKREPDFSSSSSSSSSHGRSQGPSYATSHGDRARGEHGPSSRGSSSSSGGQNRATSGGSSREDLVVSIPGGSDDIVSGDVDDGDVDHGDDGSRNFFDLHGGGPASQDEDESEGRSENIFQGPGAAAQAKESDGEKDGAAAVHSLMTLVVVTLSTLVVAAVRVMV